MFSDLYNTDILTLAGSLRHSRLENPHGSARKVSKLCGSWLEIDVNMDGNIVTDMAMRIEACALGQSSAAILQEAMIGANYEELIKARGQLKAMLKSDAAPPTGRFEKLALLADVRAYPARHGSTLLAFEAAVEATQKAMSSS